MTRGYTTDAGRDGDTDTDRAGSRPPRRVGATGRPGSEAIGPREATLDRFADRRGISISVTNVLATALTTLLITGLLIGAGGLLRDEKGDAARNELDVTGERIATEIVNVDRLAREDAVESVEMRPPHPERVVGSTYLVTLTTDCPFEACLVMESADPDVTETVSFHNETPITESTVQGGPLRIVYNGSTIRLEGERS
ncbi:hypothetical protein BRD17_10145 [Halobacteriales archaeon SW_7_68_16]|nr:MAG: hypothetical protein BRD17_10145 [Halobacteriales archaeon SW_7_68_16]